MHRKPKSNFKTNATIIPKQMQELFRNKSKNNLTNTGIRQRQDHLVCLRLPTILIGQGHIGELLTISIVSKVSQGGGWEQMNTIQVV